MRLEIEPEMNRRITDSASAEEGRIRDAYRRREEDDSRYSWFTPGHVFMMQRCERQMLALLRRCGFAELESKKILEVGCGTGHWLCQFVKWGADPAKITGVDLLPDRIAKARRLCPPAVQIQCASAEQLPFPNESFDLVLQSTVFTSILNAGMKQNIASEMLRVVRNDGFILWYDYYVDNPWNHDVQGVKKREIYYLFPACHIDLRRITLAPPLARLIAPHSWLLACLLQKIPLLCSHYLGVIRKSK